MTLNPPQNEWYFDSSASSHMTSHSTALSSHLTTLFHSSPPQPLTPSSIVVSNGYLLPVTATGSTDLTNLYALIVFLFHLNLLRILFLFVGSLSITIVMWSLTLLVVL